MIEDTVKFSTVCCCVFFTSNFDSDQGPLLDLPRFQVEMIRWDAMHIINLGVDLWVVGSVVKKLLHYDVWGGHEMEEADRLLIAYDLFKTWSRTKKVWHLVVYSFCVDI